MAHAIRPLLNEGDSYASNTAAECRDVADLANHRNPLYKKSIDLTLQVLYKRHCRAIQRHPGEETTYYATKLGDSVGRSRDSDRYCVSSLASAAESELSARDQCLALPLFL